MSISANSSNRRHGTASSAPRHLVAIALCFSLLAVGLPATPFLPGPESALAAAGDIWRVSVDSSGAQSNGYSGDSQAVSDDGRFVAFVSSSSDLVPGDTNGARDVFVHDRQTGATKRVSVSSSGEQSNWHSDNADISDDGRFVTFDSLASTLVADDTKLPTESGAVRDVFVHDLVSATTTRVSLSTSGQEANDRSWVRSISGNGRYVVFTSLASNLVAGDANGHDDVFVHDRKTGETTLESLTEWGTISDNISIFSDRDANDISDDGRYVVFDTSADRFATCSGGATDVYVRDRVAGTTENLIPCAADHNSYDGSISDDGRFVAFTSRATNLVPGDTNRISCSNCASGGHDVFVLDRITRGISRVSVSSQGVQAELGSMSTDATISTKGRYVIFESTATNLDPNNPGPGVFIHDRAAATTTRVAPANRPSMSGDGRYHVFGSGNATLVPGDTNGTSDVFVRDFGPTEDFTVAVPLPLEQTFGGTHGVNCSGCMGDPVNTATGSYTTSAVDLALPGIGLPFEFVRTYNSADASVGVLGRGWAHSFAAALTIKENGDVVLNAEDGQQLVYTKQPDGTLSLAPGARSNLKAVTGGYELTRKDQVKYNFDSTGKLSSMVDRNGHGLTFTHGTGGTLDTITDSVGRTISLEYANGRLTRVVLADGRDVSFGYTNGLLTSVTDVRDKTTTYTYDPGDRLKTITDQNQHTLVINTYNADGRVTEQVDANGKLTKHSWDPTTQTATMTDPRGNVWTDVYFNNVLQSRTDPLGNTTRYEYDADLNISKVIDPRGNVTRMFYDSKGNMIRRVAPNGLWYEEKFTYNVNNDLETYTDDRNNTTRYEYDVAGNLWKEIRPGNLVTTYTRDPATDLITSVTDPRLKVWNYGYDPQGNRTSIATPQGQTTTMTYDSSGRMESRVDPRGNAPGRTPADYKTTFTYDEANNMTAVVNPLHTQTATTYDPAGHVLTQTDGNGHTTVYTYDNMNRLETVKAPGVQTPTAYTYDPNGNLKTRTDPKGRVTSYSYDAANRLDTLTTPEGKVWDYDYDAANNLKSVTAPSGKKTTYGYDELNRLKSISYSDGTPSVAFTYDGNDNRMSMTDGSGTETYTYDPLNRLETVTRGTDTLGYEYNEAGSVRQRTYPDGTVVHYTYDDNGWLGTGVTGAKTTSYQYDEAGNLTKTILPSGNGHVENRTYDRAGRLTLVENVKGGTTLSRFAYSTLDNVGNPLRVDTENGAITYKYDDRDQLTEVCYAGACPGANDPFIRYEYDEIGNRMKEIKPAGTTTYVYDGDDRLLSTSSPSGTTEYGYDLDGNQTLTAGGRTFTYDAANRVASTTQGRNTITYSYDGDGKRIKSAAGNTITKYSWDANAPLPELVLERNDRDVLIRRYVHGNDLISMYTGGKDYYYHYDGLGSVVNLTSDTGAAQWTYAYDPFGELRTETKHATKAPTNLMRFTGELFDVDTGLYHLRARQYDALTGRFLGIDPIDTPLGRSYGSAYAYVGNRPTVFTDPSGLVMADGGGGGGGDAGPIERDPIAEVEYTSTLQTHCSTATVPLNSPSQGFGPLFRACLVPGYTAAKLVGGGAMITVAGSSVWVSPYAAAGIACGVGLGVVNVLGD